MGVASSIYMVMYSDFTRKFDVIIILSPKCTNAQSHKITINNNRSEAKLKMNAEAKAAGALSSRSRLLPRSAGPNGRTRGIRKSWWKYGGSPESLVTVAEITVICNNVQLRRMM